MNRKIGWSLAALAAVVVLGGAWMARDSALLRPVAARLGLAPADATPDIARGLAAAGVHKCRVGARTVYSDQPCPPGSRELATGGGSMTIVSLPGPTAAGRAAPALAALASAASAASAAASGPLVHGADPAEIDRMREKMIDQAGGR